MEKQLTEALHILTNKPESISGQEDIFAGIVVLHAYAKLAFVAQQKKHPKAARLLVLVESFQKKTLPLWRMRYVTEHLSKLQDVKVKYAHDRLIFTHPDFTDGTKAAACYAHIQKELALLRFGYVEFRSRALLGTSVKLMASEVPDHHLYTEKYLHPSVMPQMIS